MQKHKHPVICFLARFLSDFDVGRLFDFNTCISDRWVLRLLLEEKLAFARNEQMTDVV